MIIRRVGKKLLLTLSLITILIFLTGCSVFPLTRETPGKIVNQAQTFVDKETAIKEAQVLFQQKKIDGEDMSKGPCLSNEIVTDWVADVAHNPRESIDDDPKNQCSAYLEGKAHHFVELDPDGRLIRAM